MLERTAAIEAKGIVRCQILPKCLTKAIGPTGLRCQEACKDSERFLWAEHAPSVRDGYRRPVHAPNRSRLFLGVLDVPLVDCWLAFEDGVHGCWRRPKFDPLVKVMPTEI